MKIVITFDTLEEFEKFRNPVITPEAIKEIDAISPETVKQIESMMLVRNYKGFLTD